MKRCAVHNLTCKELVESGNQCLLLAVNFVPPTESRLLQAAFRAEVRDQSFLPAENVTLRQYARATSVLGAG
jgi:hypothetical protein